LKQVSDGDVVTSGGKLFHTRRPAMPKAWLPIVGLRAGETSSANVDAEHSRRRKSMFVCQVSVQVTTKKELHCVVLKGVLSTLASHVQSME